MVRNACKPRQQLIFHFCDSCRKPIRHAYISSHKTCSVRAKKYLYCLIDMRYEEFTNAKCSKVKAFVSEHTACAVRMHREKFNLNNKENVDKLQRLFGRERQEFGILSQRVESVTMAESEIEERCIDDIISSDDDVSIYIITKTY